MQFVEIPYCDPVRALWPFRDAPMCLLLHGGGAHPSARWSFLLLNPTDTSLATEPNEDVLGRVEQWLDQRRPPQADAPPFLGGVAGFLAYEFGATLEPAMPQRGRGALPYAALGLYENVYAFDNFERRAYEALPRGQSSAVAGAFTDAVLFNTPGGPGHIDAEDSHADYRRNVEILREHIAAGDLYQANISRRFAGALGPGDHPYHLFRRLCDQSPAPFCAYMRLPGAAIVSNSPERFISTRPDKGVLRARTSPIKGTRPRGKIVVEDQNSIAELQNSEKDKAENVMIVDLMRNDFGRVCKPGSVRAPALFALETFANVHHLVSHVEGELCDQTKASDVIRATFPAGSITGAPKIASMRLIDRIEAAPRGANYGSMVWFGFDGAMDSNVLIRTATCRETDGVWSVEFRVGGGVTIGSLPQEEADETDAKAINLIKAIRNDPA